MRRLAFAFGLVVVAAVGASAGFSGQFRSYRIDRQAWELTQGPVTTSSTDWMSIGFPVSVASAGPVSVDVSGDFEGAPLALRATAGNDRLQPSPARFDPEGNRRSFSFTFVGTTGQRGCHSVALAVRSLTGEPVTVYDVNYVLDFRSVELGHTCE